MTPGEIQTAEQMGEPIVLPKAADLAELNRVHAADFKAQLSRLRMRIDDLIEDLSDSIKKLEAMKMDRDSGGLKSPIDSKE